MSAERFRGVRIFDITDLRKPKQVAAVQTCRGSHTHTLVTDPKDKAQHLRLRLGHRRGALRRGARGLLRHGAEGGSQHRALQHRRDQGAARGARRRRPSSIGRASSPTRRPARSPGCGRAAITARARSARATTNQCHDITVFPEVGLAAGACSGNGILLDISDPVNPVRLDHVVDKNFAYWHSATFNNDGTKVIFTDEWGGGTRPRCRATDLPTWGADAIFDIVDRKLKFGGYFKMPAAQTETENCVAHNGSLIPVPGRDIMVQAWYQGGAVGVRLHRLGQPGRDRVLRSRAARRQAADHRRLLVDLLVQRPHLRLRDRARHRRLPADAERVSVAERDRRRDAGADATSSTRSSSRGSPGRRHRSWRARTSISCAQQGHSRPTRATAVRQRARARRRCATGKDRAASLDQLDTLATQLEKDAAARDRPRRRCACARWPRRSRGGRRGCDRDAIDESEYCHRITDEFVASDVGRRCCAFTVVVCLVGRCRTQRTVHQDPRVGLRPGLRDAGQAARNMELLANLPKPDGFFDPTAPAGAVDAARARALPTPAHRTTPPARVSLPATPRRRQPRGGGFTNSDLAFQGNHVVVGNYHGFNTYDIENARRPRLLASVVCPGGQGDVSVHGNLLFMSVEQTRGRLDCGIAGRAGRR